jgi:Ca-activated chloride channel homolog
MNRHTRKSNRRAAMLVLIAVCLPLCIIMAAFAVDVAWMQLVRTELRTSTDAAARAGAKELSLSQNETAAKNRAKEAARRNEVAGGGLELADNDIQIGASTQANTNARFKFAKNSAKPNAVRVTGKRTNGSIGGPVDLLFAGVLGVDTFEPQHVATSTQLDRDICLVVDRSGSMMWKLSGGSQVPSGSEGECGKPHPTLSRWGSAAAAVEAFLVELDNTKQKETCALVSYSSNTTECGNTYKISTIDADLSNDYAPIRSKMTAMSSKPVKGSTAISAGIDDGIKVLTGAKTRPFAVKTMVLMTDGIHNTGPEPVLSAQVAAENEITIHTVTFSDDADIKRMKAVASATGGLHFHADDQQELIDVFREIAATLPVMLTE